MEEKKYDEISFQFQAHVSAEKIKRIEIAFLLHFKSKRLTDFITFSTFESRN